jgi:hypothetical protein
MHALRVEALRLSAKAEGSKALLLLARLVALSLHGRIMTPES